MIDGHRYTEETIFHILVKASNTIEDTCNRVESAPSSNAIRYQLKKNLLVDIKTLEDEANKALLEHLPPGIKGKKQEELLTFSSSPIMVKPIARIEVSFQGGPRKLLKGRKSYQTTYTMKSQKYGQVSFDLWVVRKYSKYGRHGVEWFCYAILERSTFPLSRYMKDIAADSELSQAID